MSLRKFANKSELGVSFLSKFLNDKRNPSTNEKDLKKIAKVLDISEVRLIFSAGRIPSQL